MERNDDDGEYSVVRRRSSQCSLEGWLCSFSAGPACSVLVARCVGCCECAGLAARANSRHCTFFSSSVYFMHL